MPEGTQDTTVRDAAELAAYGWKLSPSRFAERLSEGRYRRVPHLELLSCWLVDAAMGRRKRVVVMMPPRHGKSELVSRWFPAWLLELWPEKRIILASYEADFAASWGRKVRDLIVNYASQLTVRLSGTTTAADEWEIVGGGGMCTAGVGGPIIGRGADLLVIDDPVKNWQEATSPTVQQRNWDWFQSTARTRLEPGAAIVLVGTRWDENDLIGRVLGSGEHWDVLNLPAIAEAGDALGREVGEALWPERFSLEDLLSIKGSMDDYVWTPLYQQRPPKTGRVGAVYHAWSPENRKPIEFEPYMEICWSLDFNVDPLASVIGQIVDRTTRVDAWVGRRVRTLHVLDEIYLPDSTTEKACKEFRQRMGKWAHSRQLVVNIYGDASGNSRKTSGRSDYEIIKECFANDCRFILRWRTGSKNPSVRDRANAVNSMLCNAAGERKLFYDPHCKELEADFKSVVWKRDGAGNLSGDIDKSDPRRTHLADAVGYLIEPEFGYHAPGGLRGEFLG